MESEVSMVFEKKSLITGRISTAIRAESSPPGWSMSVYLDNENGDVMYPVRMEHNGSGSTIVMDSLDNASIMLPPVVTETMIKSMINLLSLFSEITEAAREFIKTEHENFTVGK